MRQYRLFTILVLAGLGLGFGVSPGSAANARAAPPEGRPVAVSPGTSTGAVIGDPCPTFNWGAIRGAESYELVIYRVRENSEEARSVLQQNLPGAALGWTPSLGRCLERGGQYAWSVRALGKKGSSDWSAPSLFEVSSGPSESEFDQALAVVRQYLVSQGGAEPEGVAEAEPQPGREASASSPAVAVAAAVGTPQLSVDGGVVAASFTGDGSTLTALDPAKLAAGTGGIAITGTAANVTGTVAVANGGTGATDASGARTNLAVASAADLTSHVGDATMHHARYTDAEALAAFASTGECEGFPVAGRRWVDRGDGTVRDCNTGRIWLKDASCLGSWRWDSSPSIFTKVTDLNSGTEFSCADYTAGAYTDWEVPAMSSLCGLWDGICAGLSCCTAGQGVLDGSVSGFPTVANGKGDAKWTPGNVFVGVQSTLYWSATEFSNPLAAWLVDLYGGSAVNFPKTSAYSVWPVRVGQ